MNQVILMGRLTRDPDIRYSQSATPVAIARFSLAVDRRYKRDGEAQADFFNCTAFGSQAEFVEKYLRQGIKILLVGRLENNNYVNREGQKVYSIQVLVERLEFAESKKAVEEQQEEARRRQSPEPEADADGFINIPDDVKDEELPFN